MDEDTYAKLCDMFADPKYKEKCKVNTKNRKGLTVFYTVGTRLFAQYRKVLEIFPSVTSEIGPVELYAASHKRKNGDWLSDVAKDNHLYNIFVLKNSLYYMLAFLHNRDFDDFNKWIKFTKSKSSKTKTFLSKSQKTRRLKIKKMQGAQK
ncbi:hypothetical protein CJ030_MR7G011773 [Morella rubra]|uniref:Uncharacterized protein n=1 Tax=Morella rubra TaxID=262757 RepID=A0A6A1V4U3_9ROSI|nr:hypothetical protein CJ030_MR7G011773 [Morella rubra]